MSKLINFDRIRRSLTLRIAVPVVVLVLVLGLSLYFFVFKSISGFVRDEIQRDLESISHRLYNICNTTFDNILQSGLVDDQATLIVEKALTLGKFEDFFRQEDIEGLILEGRQQKPLLTTILPTDIDSIIHATRQEGRLITLSGDAKGYFSYHFDFTPWKWHIVIVKSEKKYAGLYDQVKKVHAYTLGLLSGVSLLLIFFIYRSVRQPIDAIVNPLKKRIKPEYEGIEAFSYLSQTIVNMMDSIKHSEEKYRSLVETTSDFVWEVDRKGNFIYASPTIKHILGYDPQALINKNPFDLMPEDTAEKVSARFRKLAFEKKPFERLENIHLHKDGHEVVLETSGVPVLDGNGDLVGYRGIDRDVTERLRIEEERQKMEKQLQQLQKLEAIGTLAGGIAHDYNNLLSVIMGNISLAKEDIRDSGLRRFLDNADSACLRAQDLTSQLITFAKGGVPVMEVGSMVDFLKEIIQQIVGGTKVICSYELPSEPWEVEFDSRQMKHALKNIVINAVEAMPQGGRLTLGAQNFEIDLKQKTGGLPLPPGKYLKIMIKDNGFGILSEHLPLVFDPYFSTKEMGPQKGMGLGLTISHSVISRHNGYINVESIREEGTTVVIYFPAYVKIPYGPKSPDDFPRTVSSRPKKILLMDDEKMLRELTHKMLQRIGYQSEMAGDGSQAVDLYKEALEAGQPYDIVILDLTVKGGMGGKETVKILKEIDPNAKVIVSSGYSNDPLMTDFKAYGFCMALPKPYNVKQLQEAISLAINGN